MMQAADMIRVSAISYTNTQPFIYGLENFPAVQGKLKLQFDPPAVCAAKLISGEVDLGIVPVAALPQISHAEIISDYCIGALGPVNSVFLFARRPLDELHEVVLDSQSRSSNNLARVLDRFFWKKNLKFSAQGLTDPEAIILIGDRTFTGREKWPYKYDLSAEWQKYTGLPFVFAVWAANRDLPEQFKTDFNQALKYGLDNRQTVIAGFEPVGGFDLDDYLMNRISYSLNTPKKEALKLYLDLLGKLP